MTPFNSCASAPNALCLHITECKCSCGNQWTTSSPLLYGNGHYGGTPSPYEEERFPLQRITKSSRHFSHCFRCVPLGLNIGWVKPASNPSPPKTKPSLAALEDDIFGNPS